MLKKLNDFGYVVVTGSLLLILVSTFIISFLLFHKRRQRSYTSAKKELELAFQQELLQSQLEIQEQTFTKISEEIHDNIGQVLSLVRLNLNTLGSNPSENKINETDALLARAIVDLRVLSHNLNTDYIMDNSLPTVVEELLMNLQKTGQFKTSLVCPEKKLKMNKEHSIILFRIIQEIINNIVKHSMATEVAVNINSESESARIEIRDNGIGFNASAIQSEGSGLGMMNMMNRARLIGAEIDVSSLIGEGTTVTIYLKNSSANHEYINLNSTGR